MKTIKEVEQELEGIKGWEAIIYDDEFQKALELKTQKQILQEFLGFLKIRKEEGLINNYIYEEMKEDILG